MSEVNKNEKKLCGLWHAHTSISEYNEFGKCKCLDCFGAYCHHCRVYAELQSRIMDILEKTKCDKCLGR